MNEDSSNGTSRSGRRDSDLLSSCAIVCVPERMQCSKSLLTGGKSADLNAREGGSNLMSSDKAFKRYFNSTVVLTTTGGARDDQSSSSSEWSRDSDHLPLSHIFHER